VSKAWSKAASASCHPTESAFALLACWHLDLMTYQRVLNALLCWRRCASATSSRESTAERQTFTPFHEFSRFSHPRSEYGSVELGSSLSETLKKAVKTVSAIRFSTSILCLNDNGEVDENEASFVNAILASSDLFTEYHASILYRLMRAKSSCKKVSPVSLPGGCILGHGEI
jgi:hypothetical protein